MGQDIDIEKDNVKDKVRMDNGPKAYCRAPRDHRPEEGKESPIIGSYLHAT